MTAWERNFPRLLGSKSAEILGYLATQVTGSTEIQEENCFPIFQYRYKRRQGQF